ncbi:MAG: 50S ribosomal protein L17 [Bacteroidales bacterium]
MRHRKAFNHLGRKSGHRKAMLANMASSLILHKKIETTEAKAKALKIYVEPLITKSKDDTTHSRRTVFAYLKQKEAVTELFRVVAPKVADRPGGYTRVLKIGFRKGDGADMALIELVDFNEAALSATASESKKSTTRRGRSKKKADAPKVESTVNKSDQVSDLNKESTPEEEQLSVEESVAETKSAPEKVEESPQAEELPEAEESKEEE